MAENMQIKITAEAAQAVSNVKLLSKSLAELETKLKDFQAAAAVELNPGKLKAYNQEIVSLKAQIASLKTAGTDSFGNVGKAAGTAFSAIRKIAFILPGVGIAGLIGFAADPIINYVESLFQASDAIKKLKEDQDKFNKSLEEAGSKGLSTGAQLQAFVNIARDSTLPLTQRNEALREANKILGEHGEKLTLATVATGAATREVELYTNALINEAIAAKQADRIADLRIQQTAATKKYTEALKDFNRAQKSSFQNDAEGGVAFLAQSSSALSKLNGAARDYRAISDQLIETTNDLFSTELKATQGFGDLGIKAKETSKKVETIDDVLAKLARSIKLLSQEEIDIGVDKSKQKISEINSAINHLVKDFKVSEKDTIIQKLIGDIRNIAPPIFALQRALENFKIKTSAEILVDQAQAQKEADEKLGKNPIILHAKVDLQGADQDNDFIKNLKALYKKVDEINKQAAADLKSTFNDALASIGESIAESFQSGANFGETVFGNLFKVLGAGLKQLGEAMIAIGTAKIALEKFKFVPGIGTVIAGIAAVAIGQLLQSAIPGFAAGVENFGGGLAVVGERGPELVRLPSGSDVIPNHRIGDIGGGGVQVFIPETRISGADIVISYNRQTARNNRNS